MYNDDDDRGIILLAKKRCALVGCDNRNNLVVLSKIQPGVEPYPHP